MAGVRAVVTWDGLNPPYATIVADPPWPVRYDGRTGGRRRNDTRMGYSTMPINEITALPVFTLTAESARLFLWVTAELNREGVGVAVVRAWGFRPVAEFVWEKPNLGMGHFPRACHEMLLVALRGKANWPDDLRNVRSVQRWAQPYTPQTGGYAGKTHSAKPPAALDLIERASPAPRVELFARAQRLGWDSWGFGHENFRTG